MFLYPALQRYNATLAKLSCAPWWSVEVQESSLQKSLYIYSNFIYIIIYIKYNKRYYYLKMKSKKPNVAL